MLVNRVDDDNGIFKYVVLLVGTYCVMGVVLGIWDSGLCRSHLFYNNGFPWQYYWLSVYYSLLFSGCEL